MPEPVKRGYRQSARAATARQTRRAVVQAAVSLYEEQGFGATTVEEIAARAGVGRRTVFQSVGGKLDALKLALDWAVTGDDEDAPLSARSEIEAIAAQTDPARAVLLWAALTTRIDTRLAPLSRILSGAADLHPEARDMRRDRQSERLEGQRAFARHLRQLGGVAQGYTVRDAADELWLYSDPLLYDRLVNDRGWSTARFRRWLARTVATSLLERTGS